MDDRASTSRQLHLAHDQCQWQIFTELDLHGESEQIKLASFLDSLIQDFSSEHKPIPTQCFLDENDPDDDFDDFDEERQAEDLSPRARASGPIITLSRGRSFSEIENISDYGPIKKITPLVAAEIVEVYRRGGKLAVKSVKKILRDVYKYMKESLNVVPVTTPPEGGHLHIVGDLHGQLSDLLHILQDAGMPSERNKFIFNGDFVDRGPCSVEVLLILFSLLLAFPNAVFLNRGNHEDHAICCQPPPPHGSGGFQKEMKAKYDDLIFSMAVEVFRYLPIVHIIDNKVMVVHGGWPYCIYILKLPLEDETHDTECGAGLFGQRGVTLKDLADIDRLDYCPGSPPQPTSVLFVRLTLLARSSSS
jgi:hypothetical protein